MFQLLSLGIGKFDEISPSITNRIKKKVVDDVFRYSHKCSYVEGIFIEYSTID